MRKIVKTMVKSLPGLKNIYETLNNQYARDEFIIACLKLLPTHSVILDAGCGSSRYREYCKHLNYKSQDFGQYSTDLKRSIGSDGVGGLTGYQYGTIDYVGNIWEINEKAETFDAILCTEVLEHIPYPIKTIKEFSRLLKPNATLILTAPSNCLRHMDPYFFFSGFSDRWYYKVLTDNGFKIEKFEAVGDYYSWLAVEMARTAAHNSIFAKMMLGPAFIYFYNKKKTEESIDTLCMGYHVVARKT